MNERNDMIEDGVTICQSNDDGKPKGTNVVEVEHLLDRIIKEPDNLDVYCVFVGKKDETEKVMLIFSDTFNDFFRVSREVKKLITDEETFFIECRIDQFDPKETIDFINDFGQRLKVPVEVLFWNGMTMTIEKPYDPEVGVMVYVEDKDIGLVIIGKHSKMNRFLLSRRIPDLLCPGEEFYMEEFSEFQLCDIVSWSDKGAGYFNYCGYSEVKVFDWDGETFKERA